MKVEISNTDKECVALRKAGVILKEKKRIPVIMETLGCDERTAKRFDWFVKKLSQGGVPLLHEAIAAAWVANEAFYFDDGVNDWPFAWAWDGKGGGDFTLEEETGRIVPVTREKSE